MENQSRKYLAELLGTFCLVFIGTSVATLQGFLSGYGGTGWLGISAAFGGTLAVLVLVIGPVSGCHVNPAVSIAMCLSKRLDVKLLPGYLAAQFIGAILASIVLLTLLKGIPSYELAQHGLGANGNPREMGIISLLGFEVVMTALFLFTIFAATREDTPAGFAAVAIGGFLFVAHLVGAQLGDSSLNPARSLGPALFAGGNAMSILWIFVAGPIIGGIIGWQLYKFTYND